MSELKPIAYAIYGIGCGKHYLKDVKPIPADDVTEEWRGDDDFLGDYWAGNEPLFLASTQPEATKPAQDLGAAILALPFPETTLSARVAGFTHKVYGVQHMRDMLKAAAALASPADALVAGDSETVKDAALYREIRKWNPKQFTDAWARALSDKIKFDELVNAAIQAQKDGHG